MIFVKIGFLRFFVVFRGFPRFFRGFLWFLERKGWGKVKGRLPVKGDS